MFTVTPVLIGLKMNNCRLLFQCLEYQYYYFALIISINVFILFVY